MPPEHQWAPPAHPAWGRPLWRDPDDWELLESMPYVEGDPIPPGYRRVTRPNRALLATGTSLAAVGYGVSMIAAPTMNLFTRDHRFTPLLVPLAGPFIALGTAEPDGGFALWLTINGIAQNAGLGMFIASFLWPDERLQLTDPSLYAYRWSDPPPRPRPLVKGSDGGPIEPGYHREQHAHRPLLVAGGLAFGLAYGIALLVGATAAAEGQDARGALPMFIPIAGPAITIETEGLEFDDDEAQWVIALIANTASQVAGAALLVVGAAVDRDVLVRDDAAEMRSPLRPTVRIAPGSASLSWSF